MPIANTRMVLPRGWAELLEAPSVGVPPITAPVGRNGLEQRDILWVSTTEVVQRPLRDRGESGRSRHSGNPTSRRRASARHLTSTQQVASWRRLSLGCLPRSRPLALATFIALPGAQPDQVGLELSHHRQDVAQQPPDRVSWIVDRPTQRQADPPGGELIGDCTGIGQGPGQPVELGHHQGVLPAKHAASASRRPGRSRLVPVRPWST